MHVRRATPSHEHKPAHGRRAPNVYARHRDGWPVHHAAAGRPLCSGRHSSCGTPAHSCAVPVSACARPVARPGSHAGASPQQASTLQNSPIATPFLTRPPACMKRMQGAPPWEHRCGAPNNHTHCAGTSRHRLPWCMPVVRWTLQRAWLGSHLFGTRRRRATGAQQTIWEVAPLRAPAPRRRGPRQRPGGSRGCSATLAAAHTWPCKVCSGRPAWGAHSRKWQGTHTGQV